MSYSQKTLQQFIARRHPLYEAMKAHWDFLEETYEGGRAWFVANLHRYIKEGEKEYEDRLARAYRFNHSREVVDLLDKYVFKMEIQRNEDAPDYVQRFWKRATLSDLPITEFMKRVSNRTSTFGRVWIVVDSTKSDEVQTIADEKATDSRVYAYIIKPQHALDMSFDQFGKLNWILFYETERDDGNPITSSGNVMERYRLWTRDSSQLFRVEYKRGKPIIIEDAPVKHGLGVVPVFWADNMISDDVYTSPALIADVAYLDRAVANYLSNLDAVIQDQTFSQLTIPSQAIESGTEGYDKLVEMGTKRIFAYDGSGGGKPEFISPDVKQAELILQVVSKIINEIYHSVGLAGERTKQDNSQGIDNSSGVAKAYDFERVNSLLAAKADALEAAERKLCELAARWNGEEIDIAPNAALVEERQMVSYPKDFDVRGLYDEFDIAARLSLIEAPDSVRRQQMEAVIRKLFPMIKQDLIGAMKADLKNWPPVDALAAPGAGATPMGKGELQKTAGRIVSNQLVKSS
ncbi:hypothetical protein WS89_04345 [Burkholderia sp. MSMB1072]|uniref:hypothetical protein n=1 Tax=Burkholderia sp. MSMB1072 TaxID=1637871 RepID=UPI00075B96DF|nr:hypothetical protein [Burkholderia sp. MSMB1072]KVH64520.1 hypothetical protein WS89_04345 [Burkholderia sp. MSMB1072]